MPQLVTGPLLRHVSDTAACVWVETDRPCQIRVLDSTAQTFTVHDHHYALVEIDGLSPGSATPYEVMLDDERVWPERGSPFPPSRLRTLDPNLPLRVAFGSCRVSLADTTSHGIDALAAYASTLARSERDNTPDTTGDTKGHPARDPGNRAADDGAAGGWPSVLLLVGDQVYADDPPPQIRTFIRDRRSLDEPPGMEVVDYAEYAELYRQAWTTDGAVRWLLSTVPTFMIFDDHDIRDDWNTSHTWRRQMAATPWWQRRIVAGLGSYWVYQHLGNLSADERAADPVFPGLRRDGSDNAAALDAFAERADAEPAGTRWSYSHDFGRTRLIVLDSRCGRVLTPEHRLMLDEAELAWFDKLAHGEFDHLLVATSLPYLLPEAVHHMEAWNEAVCEGAWGRPAAYVAERIRQGWDLEHWAAFDHSFRSVAQTVLSVAHDEPNTSDTSDMSDTSDEPATSDRPDPASITFLSGDVHYSYLAQVTRPRTRTPIFQAVCSPLRNPLAGKLRLVNAASRSMTAWPPARLLARLAGVPVPPVRWRIKARPDFANSIATIHIEGRAASIQWASPVSESDMRVRAAARLTGRADPTGRTPPG
jgi:hypothetical protein